MQAAKSNRLKPDLQALYPSRMESISELINFDIRHTMFRNATRFVDYELIPGDIFEFGVYTGRSLALIAHYHEVNKKSIHQVDFARRIVGFDSFEGLPAGGEHPRWKTGLFSVNHSFHPICKQGDKVTQDIIFMLFEKYDLPAPWIESGPFTEVLPRVIGTKYQKAALVHVDCDLYESTRTVLFSIAPILQEGTILLFDDWFNFRGSKAKGEQKAFFEFVESQTKWGFTEYQCYATFGKSFIITSA
jgi:O-methyltransferase